MKRATVEKSFCVACGCCKKVCPKGAVTIHKGIFATINNEICIGCGKCALVCPASVILLEELN